MASSPSKPKVKMNIGAVVVGPLDCGKSTLCGRLLYELGSVSDRELEKLRKQAREVGKDSFVYAFVMDRSKDERSRGVTIQCCTKPFSTHKYNYNIIDAPGHQMFIKNTIYGMSRADIGIIVVSAHKYAFHYAIQKGKNKTLGQLRHNIRLCYLMGIKKLIVCVNKMDAIKYNQNNFIYIKQKLSKILNKLGFKSNKIPFIPISAWNGDNLLTQSVHMSWWNGFDIIKSSKTNQNIHGITLYDALNKIKKPSRTKYILNKPFIMPIEGIYKIKGVGDVITGRIEEGQIDISRNQNVYFYPRDCFAKIFSIKLVTNYQEGDDTINCAKAGDYIGINVKGLDKSNMPIKGDVMLHGDNLDMNPVQQVIQFEALIYVESCVNQIKCRQEYTKFNQPGYTPIVYIRNGKSPCKLIKILWKRKYHDINQKNIIYGPKYIEYGDLAQVIFQPKIKIFIKPFDESQAFGRIAVMDHSYLVMIGKVLKVYNFVNKNDTTKVIYCYTRLYSKSVIPDDIVNLINVFYGCHENPQQTTKVQHDLLLPGYDPSW